MFHRGNGEFVSGSGMPDERRTVNRGSPMRLYGELAEWWPLLDDPADYAEEAALYGDLLAEACDAPIGSLLELGCGGGNSAGSGICCSPTSRRRCSRSAAP